MIRKKILITDGTGFIGSNLCQEFINKKNEVICLDNFSTGNKDNIKHFISKPNFKLIEHDVCLPIDIEVDEIYNLACPASPIQYQKNPVQTIKTSVIGAMNMLDLSKKQNAKILHASTSEIYGDSIIHPQTENYKGSVNIIGPRACYGESKRCAETLFYDFNKQYQIKVKIVRIFNTYGPKMHINDGRVISNFIAQAIQNKDLTVYGNGNQTRSFCFIDDMIDGFIHMMDSNDNITGPINLGSTEEIEIIKLAKKIIILTNSSSKIVFKPLPIDEPKKRKPSIKLANEKLNWKPNTSLDKGLLKTIDYFNFILKGKLYD